MVGMKTKREDDPGCSGLACSTGAVHPRAGLCSKDCSSIFVQIDPGLKKS